MTWPTKTDFVDGDVLTAAQVNNIGTNLNLFNPTSATAGQVPVADGAGSVAFGDIAGGAYTLITSGTITSTQTTNITGITQDYKHLELWLWNLSFSSNSSLRVGMSKGTWPGQAGSALWHTLYGTYSPSAIAQYTNGGSFGYVNLFDGSTIGTSPVRSFFRGRWYNYSEATTEPHYAEGTALHRAASNDAIVRSSGYGAHTSANSLDALQIYGSNTINSAKYIIWGIN